MWVAPYEQIYKGSKANRQPSVDIYALAASFYYAVTGQKPTPSMERRLDNRPLKSPKEINRNLSEHLDTAITLGMALEKENRPQSMSDWLQKLELPPPPVEPKYRQEKANPQLQVNPRSAQNSIQEKPKNVSWGWLMFSLIFMFISSGIPGCILGINSATWPVVAVAVAVTWAVAGAKAMSWTLNEDEDGAVFLTWVLTAIGVVVVAGVVAGVGAVAGVGFQFMAGAMAQMESLKYFSRFHSFLIFAGTNLSGLASGWWLGFLLHPKG
jgi:serine/threonine-protein kinase